MDREDDNFLSRWSRRKVQVRDGGSPLPEPTQELPQADLLTPRAPRGAVAAATGVDAATAKVQAGPDQDRPAAASSPPASPEPPPLTLADVAALNRESDYGRFVARSVQPEVRNAALKKLFTDPHFNVMDGLDTYIEDYGLPDPLPEGMLRKMTQSVMLGLFADDPQAAAEPALVDKAATPGPPTLPAVAGQPEDNAPPSENEPNEDPDLRLQQEHDAGRAGPEPGPGQDAGGQQ